MLRRFYEAAGTEFHHCRVASTTKSRTRSTTKSNTNRFSSQDLQDYQALTLKTSVDTTTVLITSERLHWPFIDFRNQDFTVIVLRDPKQDEYR